MQGTLASEDENWPGQLGQLKCQNKELFSVL